MAEEIIPGEDCPIIPDGSDAKVLRVKQDTLSLNLDSFLGAAVQLFNMGSIVGKIEKGIEYVVQVPAQYQKAVADGTLKMLQGKKSGKTWATIVRELPNGKKEFVSNCPIKEQMVLKGDPIGRLTEAAHNMLMQKKLDDIKAQVEEIYNVVLRIEQGQMDDRIGKLLSGKQDLDRAFMNSDAESRKRELELARSKISEAQNQIGQTLKSLIEKFPEVPTEEWKLLLKSIFSLNSNYKSQLNQEFLKVQDYYDFYLKATNLLAYSYSVVGDLERATHVFDQVESFLESIFYGRILTVDVIYPKGEMDDAFHHQPLQYIRSDEAICLDEAKPFEYVEIVVDGEKLMGVINRGK